METEDEGPLTVGLAVLQGKYDVHGRGLVNKGQRSKPWDAVLLEGGAPGYLLCCIASDVLRLQNKERDLPFNSL